MVYCCNYCFYARETVLSLWCRNVTFVTICSPLGFIFIALIPIYSPTCSAPIGWVNYIEWLQNPQVLPFSVISLIRIRLEVCVCPCPAVPSAGLCPCCRVMEQWGNQWHDSKKDTGEIRYYAWVCIQLADQCWYTHTVTHPWTWFHTLPL